MSSHASMNRIFRLVWNEVAGTWVAVAEVSRWRVKRSGRAARRMAALLAASSLTGQALAAPPAPAPNQLPTGGSVAAGAAALRSTPGSAQLNIDQSSQRAVINWSTFDIGSAAQVNFNQPGASSVTLNRVLGGDGSQIAGRITAPGQVFLSNPNGILFSKTATVDVGGLAATTLGISDTDFMAGKAAFTSNGAAGSVVNEGTLRASLGGYIALLAPEVRNQGVVIARLGTAALAAGDAVSLDFDVNSRLAGITVRASAVKALVDNQGAVLAPGGLIVLSAQALDRLLGGVVNNSGQVEATGFSEKAGRILLEASDRVASSGSLSADGAAGAPAGSISINAQDIALGGLNTATAAGGQGGSIELAASRNVELTSAVLDVSGSTAGGVIRVQGGATPLDLAAGADGPGAATLSGDTRLLAASRAGAGGRISVTADTVEVLDHSQLDASGATGGGTVQLGGGYQGSGGLAQARRLRFDEGATADVSATGQGNGGTLSLWTDIHRADSVTIANGTLRAAGGLLGGDGGHIETSGHWIDSAGARVDASAVHGAAGDWLFDPYNVTVSYAPGTNNSNWAPTGSGSILSNQNLQPTLNNGTSVTVTTGTSGSEVGDINIEAGIFKSQGADVTLTFKAANTITINAPITGTSNKLNLVLDADNNNGSRDGAGVIILNSNISTNGGSLKFGTGATLAVNGVTTQVGGDVYVGGTGAQTIATGNGTIAVNGEMIVANPSGLSINSGNGSVSFNGLLNSGNTYTSVAGTTGTGSWDQAFTAAKGSTAGGAAVGDTYLATITSRLENAVASRAGNYAGAWIGAHRDVSNGGGFTWRWVAGPEGLEAGGLGRAFFQQATSGGGGTAINGQFSNFASGEPNGSGTTGEQAGQFFGTLAQWNDLASAVTYGGSSSYAVTQYLREKNIAASPLTVTAGNGTVTFAGMVGGYKALASLNVTAATVAVNGGGVTTQGLQTYNGDVSLGSASTTLTQTNADTDFTVQANRFISNGSGVNASLKIATTREIIMAAGSVITSSGPTLTTVFNADSDGNGDGGIWLQAGSNSRAQINSNGAPITLSGGADPTTGYAQGAAGLIGNGVTIDGAVLDSGGGNIVIRGRSALASTAYTSSDFGTNNTSSTDGVRLHGSVRISAGSGTIDINGVARGTDTSPSIGVETSSTGYSRLLSSANSGTAINIFGDASGGTATAKGWGTFLGGANAQGILLAATGTAGITVNGIGRDLPNYGGGLQIEPNAYVLASSGAILLTGTKGASSTYSDVVINGGVGFVASLPSGWAIASPVTASSSNITLSADTLRTGLVFGSGTLATNAVQSSGTLTLTPRTAGKALTVQAANPGGSAAWINFSGLYGASGLLKPGFGKVVFGSSTTGDVTLDNYTVDTATEIDTAGNAVLGNIGVATHTLAVVMTGSGSITDTGNVAVSSLALSGSSSAVTLDSSGNAIGTVAANVGSLALTNGGALTVGSAGGITGITAAGTVAIDTLTGDLTLAQNIVSANTGTSAVVLNAGKSAAAGTASGGNLLRPGSATVTTGSGGRATLMTGSVSNSTGLTAYVGSGSGRFRYGSDESTTAYSSALGSGLNVVYREQPLLTATASSASKVYDGIAYSGGNGVTVTGYANGDTSAALIGSPSYGGGSQGATAANTYAITPTLLNSLGYGFTYVSGTLTISPRPVSLTGSRVYNGSTGIAGGVLTVANRVGSDSLSLSGSGTLASGSVGSRAISAFGSLAIGGASAANYTLSGASGSVTITVLPVSLTGTRAYDGTAGIAGAALTVANLMGSDSLSLTGSGTLSSKNVGSRAISSFGSLALGGSSAGNYTLVGASGSATLTAAALAVTAPSGVVKTYDGTATVQGNTATVGALAGAAAGEIIGTAPVLSYANANAGTGKTVQASGLQIHDSGGVDVTSNYALNYVANTGGIINAAPLTVTVPGGVVKTYDGTTNVQGAAATIGMLAGAAAGETVGTAPLLTYDTATASTGKTVSASGLQIRNSSGADVTSNYAVSYVPSTSGVINRAPLTITANADARFVSESDSAGFNGASYSGFVGSEGTGVLGGALVVSRPNASNDVTPGTYASALVPSGVTSSNYSIAFVNGAYTIVPADQLLVKTTNSSVAYGTAPGFGNVSARYLDSTSQQINTLTELSRVGNTYTFDDGAGGTIGFTLSLQGVVNSTANVARIGNYAVGDATASQTTLHGNAKSIVFVGNRAVTRAALTPTASSVAKVYDGTTAMAGVTIGLSGSQAGDLLTVSGVGEFSQKNVGTGLAYSVSGLSLGGADANNYYLNGGTTFSGSNGIITAAPLALSGVAAASKIYDALSTATLTGAATVNGFGSDVVSLSGTGVGSFANKNVGAAKSVTVSGYTLTGADAGNYTLALPTNLTASITAAPLIVGGSLSAVDKTYDALLTATLTGTPGVTALGSDVVSLGGSGVASFANKNVGTAKAVTVSGYTLTGADAGNYTLVQPTGLTATITAAPISVGGNLAALGKTYDATTVATLTGALAVTALSTDSVGIGGIGVASFADKNVGTAKAVTVSGYTLTGADAGNYTFAQPAGLTASITAAPIAVGGNLAALGKVYDTSTAATLTGAPTVTALGGDALGITGTGVASFANKNVGTAKSVTVSGYTLTGADAGNYTLVQPTGLTATITAAPITVGGNLAALGKTYDATTVATLTGTPTVTALNTDAVGIGGTGVGSFVDKNVGTAKSVTVSGYTLTGADAGNYTLVQPTGLTATITPAAITLAGNLAALGRVYDATTAATLTGALAVTALSTDSVGIGGTGVASFADKNVGTAKAVTVSGYTLTGVDAGNYTFAQPAGLTASITAAPIAVGGNLAALGKVYDTSTAATLTGAPTVTALGGDALGITGTGVASFANKNVGTAKSVTVSGYTLTGADAGNYTLVQPTGLTATITAAPITVGGNLAALGKTYDATTVATLTGALAVTALSTDSVGIGGIGIASFADKNVGTSKSVTVSGYTLTGADAGNYTFVQPTGLTASITPAAITLAGNLAALGKTYDATTTATLTGAPTVTALGTDSVSLGGTGVASFADKNVGTAKAVTVTGYLLGGADAGNYLLIQPTGLTADVTPRSLAVTATAAGKVYDGSTGVLVTLSDDRIGGDVLSLGYTSASFADKNAGIAKTVGVYGIALTGADAANYRVAASTTATADVAKASLQVVATGVAKTYDATTQAAVTLSDNALAGDSLVLNYGSATLVDKNAGTGKAVTVSGISVTGTDAGNYAYNIAATTTVDVSRATLTVGAVAQSRRYDGTTTVAATLTDNRLTGDQLVLSYGTAGFADASIGVGKPVSITGIRITGGDDQGNYLLASSSTTAAADILQPAASSQTDAASLPPVPAPVTVPVPVAAAQGGVDLTLPPVTATGGATTVALAPAPVAVPAAPSSTLVAAAAGPGDASGAVVVALDRPSSAGQPGVVTVSVPKTITSAETGFTFPLPAQVAQTPGSEAAQIQLLNGGPLPSWLSYSGATKSFNATSAPAGALPVELVIRVGAQEWRVTVTERSDK